MGLPFGTHFETTILIELGFHMVNTHEKDTMFVYIIEDEPKSRHILVVNPPTPPKKN